jgi:hypothetical protein
MQASFRLHDILAGRLTITLSRVLLLILFVTLVTIEQSPSAYATNLTVQTKSGAVQGLNVGAVNQWRGIPYAVAPVEGFTVEGPNSTCTWSGCPRWLRVLFTLHSA